MKQKNTIKKSKARAILCFIFAIISFLPLINYITIPLSLYFGFKSLKNIKKDPVAYGGKGFAIAGLTISILILIFTLTGFALCLSGNKEICTAMGLLF